MAEALAWGILAGSSLVLGGFAALFYPIGRQALGLIMAFGAGVLISAVAFELVHEAFETAGGEGGVPLGLLAGSFAFFLGDALIDRMGGQRRKASSGEQASGSPRRRSRPRPGSLRPAGRGPGSRASGLW
jgi:ZIP family zinc transporter